jgi:rSAM/selenodomain-associated transferase 2
MISVVIPTVNEAARIGGLVSGLRAQDPSCEIIVIDGGSEDDTRAVARAAGASIVAVSRRGRGTQLAAGGAVATGEIIWFLHADTALPAGALAAIERTMADHPDCPGGNFRLLFDGDDPFSRWLNGFYAWLRRRGLFYGDSGIFVRRTVMRKIDGIMPMALMEDYDFVRRLRRAGTPCCIADPPLVSSSRRFAGRHPVAIVWGWIVIHILFHLRVPPDRLARLYNSDRSRS